MAAYAAVTSLMHILEQIQNHPRLSTSIDKKQIEPLCRKVIFLQEFLEYCSNGGTSREAEDFEREIASAAHEAEDAIESHIVDQIYAGSNLRGESSLRFMVYLRRVIEQMDLIEEKAMKFKGKMGSKDPLPTYSDPAASSSNYSVVCCDDESIQLMDWLTGQRSNRQIIPIVGMGGIGKTTLARNVYENLFIVQHFDVRAWVTISQEYSVRKILLELLSCLGVREKETSEYSEAQLGEKLYKSLFGRRYLIILDDIWSVQVWDKIKFFIPESYNRSRVVVTNRLSNMAIHFGSLCLSKKLLDPERSWSLFCEKGFDQEGCPPELEVIGKEIVNKCGGLPLSIVVMGGLVGKDRRREQWERAAKDVNSTLNSRKDEHCFNLLSLSYSHLPLHLKPCFLYMGIFPEDHIINVSRLTKQWVAEGFLKPNKTQALEETAMGYLKDLVDRNLVFVEEWGWNGRIKTCRVHDLVRDVCLRIGKKEKFLCVTSLGFIPQGIDRERRIAFHDDILVNHHHRLFDDLHPASLARSLIFDGEVELFQCRLLRVLEVVNHLPQGSIFQLVNSRYLSCVGNIFYLIIGDFFDFRIPSSISLLWNLQTIILESFNVKVIAPLEIWKMHQLRHFRVDLLLLPDPPFHEPDGFVLSNLQTLRQVENLGLSEEVCKRIPNIKKLHLYYHDVSKQALYYFVHNLGSLQKLESLNLLFWFKETGDALLHKFTFPRSLKKLSLRNCHLNWEDLTMIGSLPHLEVLKLEIRSVKGKEWSPVEGQFLRLKILKLSYLDLNYWNAESSHFPVLEQLSLEHLMQLEEIPLSIGEIPTLGLISLDVCSISAAVSAMKILQEQESFGNYELRVRVNLWHKVMQREFRDKMEKESFVSSNLFFQPELSVRYIL